MGRKTKEIRITSGTAETNRDFGKVFTITEMSAVSTEQWASDALHGLAQSGVDLPDDIKSTGTMGIATLGLKALGGMPSEMLHGLMDRMMATVTYYPDPNHREISRGYGSTTGQAFFENDIEEVSTLIRLRAECFSVHTGFTWADVKSLGGQTTTGQN